ncbi:MAG TPA: hypothetical protein VEG08_14725 [Terriglobales bacterium]|nr:hypothetical protein [Terriglobales bacterium]
MAGERKRVAVFKFASCDGCQLALLGLEEELTTLVGELDLAFFPEARSQNLPGPYDVALVEGSITTAEDVERIKQVRQQSKYLVAVGSCANAGGIQCLRNWAKIEEFVEHVYATPQYISTLAESTPIDSHVSVDFVLHGCPINKQQLLEVLTSLLLGRLPHLPAHSVCVECKRRGNVCVLVSKAMPCLGPITHAGCGALCPAFNRGCYGCYGPMENPNPEPLIAQMEAAGIHGAYLVRVLRGFAGYAEVFRNAGDNLEKTLQ